MASSSSTNQTGLRCLCGLRCVVRTSTTDANPGRLFWGCPLYPCGCNFFRWINEESEVSYRRQAAPQHDMIKMIGRLEKTIEVEQGLVKELEAIVKDLEMEVSNEKFKKNCCIFLLIILVLYCII
ncbi:hypothetical protein ACHQM5_023914 [Ranunculus cassubicifolius]